ncbi:MAG TPA: tetratricopeptide repeat protein [Polyangiaceae bacterium]|nr:tetratricopeptide repeat protein [Polyangiaceae bacterium]
MRSDRDTRARRRAPALVAVTVAALLFHASSARFGLSYLDDDVLAPTPASVAASGGVLGALAHPYFPTGERDHAYYRPLVSASFALDAVRGDGDPASFHVTNVALHALTGAALLLLFESFGYATSVALFAALVFVAHPALAGAVAWIPGRDDLMLGLFSVLAWLFFRRANAGGGPRERVLHGLCFGLALASKETALALPCVLVLEGRLLDKRPWRELFALWPLAVWGVVTALYVAVRGLVLGPALGLGGGASGSFIDGLRGLLSGFGELVVPLALPVLAVPADMPVALGFAALAAFGAAWGWSGARRTVLGVALAASALFAAPSLPALARLLLESRLYLPAVPLALAVAELAARVRLPERSKLALGGFVLTLSAAATLRHVALFRDRLVLAKAVVEGSPSSPLAHRNLGVAYQLRGESELARTEYRRALALDPDEPVAHNNLAVILMAEGRLPEAEVELRAELARHPASAEAEKNLALVRRALNR